MAFDEQLRRAFETLSDHLRDEIARQTAAVAAELGEAAAKDRDAAVQAVRAELDSIRQQADHEREAALAAVAQEHEQALAIARQEAAAAAAHDQSQALIAARREAADAARDEAEREIATRLANATQIAEARAKSQADLESQARIAALETAVREAEQRAKAAHDASADAIARAAARSSATRATPDSIDRLADAIRAMDRETSLRGILTALAGALGHAAPRSVVLLLEGGRFRAFQSNGFETAIAPFGYADAGLAGDVIRDGQIMIASGRMGEFPAFAGTTSGSAMAAPITIGGQAVAVVYADHAGAWTNDDWTSPIDLLVRHAASSLAAVTAFKAARALVVSPEPPSSKSDATDEHEAARRYARLLVSEIKLYHEPEVLAGRRDRDLATRLAGEIERARTLYLERVSPAVRASADYFHAELVRTLANGDSALLGT